MRPKPKPEPVEQPPADDVATIKWGLELQRALAQTVSGVLIRGARPVPVGLSPSARRRPTTNSDALMGLSIKNTSYQQPCTVQLYDGADTTGDLVLEVELSPSESAREWFGLAGVSLLYGLYYHDPSNLTRGSVFLRGSDF